MTPARPSRPATSWAPEVSPVPIRRSSREALRENSKRRAWGFSDLELQRIRAYFVREGRDPTDVELAGLAQSWSEHCSYKSSRPYLRKAFARLHSPPKVLGTGDAGVVALNKELAYALRIESHNHPSAIEPYGGAATGIGGILRDVLAVGAKPIALTDPIFFGPLDLPTEKVPPGVKSPRYVMSGVVAGIRDYGNRVGVPTVGGGVYFDPAYTVNPLVNVACLGLLPRKRLIPNRAERAGNRLVLVGGLTGRDGIGGVAFASQELTERSEEESRGAVQLGDPLMKEPLIHACLEAYERGLVRSVKDLGGGGLATASGELAHAGGLGSVVHLDRVPLREPGLRPWEIWVSESQERMLLDVRPTDVASVLAIFERHDVPATEVGEFRAGAVEEIRFRDRLAARLKLAFRLEPPPPKRPTTTRRPADHRSKLGPGDPVPGLFRELVLAPDSVSREGVIRVYDHDVQGRSALRSLQGAVATPTHGDASILRPDPGSWVGLAVATAAQPWACRADPRAGAMWVVEEAARNLFAVGARPDAFTNCLNFGNPEDPAVMGDFSDVTDGLARAATELGFSAPSGNVSFYNGGLGAGIPPTPVLMAVGVIPDLRFAVSSDLKSAGNPLFLVGDSLPELGGSLYARRRPYSGEAVPTPNPRRLHELGERLLRAGAKGLIRSAHDVSDGGLAVTLAEMAFGGGVGFSADLSATGLVSPQLGLVAEGGSRWVVEVPADREKEIPKVFGPGRVTRLGTVLAERIGAWKWKDRQFPPVDLTDLYTRWREGVGVP